MPKEFYEFVLFYAATWFVFELKFIWLVGAPKRTCDFSYELFLVVTLPELATTFCWLVAELFEWTLYYFDKAPIVNYFFERAPTPEALVVFGLDATFY